MNPLIKSSSYFVFTAALIACGGGGGGGGLASGGISGSGSGTVTGIGSIFLNDNGRYETTEANVVIDDTPSTENDIKLGMVVQADLSSLNDDDPSLRTGDADSVVVSHEIKGPITSTTPTLQVLGQTVVVTGDTFVQNSGQDGQDDTQSINISTLIIGDEVEVSGHRDDSGILQASRVEHKLAGLSEWKLVGDISGLSGTSFNIQNQPVDIGLISPQDCSGSLTDGLRVEIKATPQGGFTPGDTLTTVTEVECKPNQLTFGGTISGTIEGEFEGFITSIGANSFTLGEQPVTWDSNTLFEGGTSEDLAVGVKLDARGDFNGTTLDADRIRFRHTRFRIIAPGTLTATDSVEALGLTLQVTAQTEDDDNLVNEGTTNTSQIRVRGFIDSSGALFADEIDDRGAADSADTRLRGPVDDSTIDTVGQTFEILGITILGATATEYKIEDVIVTDTQFFNALTNDSEVDVDAGSYNSGANTITGAKLEIEIED